MDIDIVKVDDENVDQLIHLIAELAKYEHLEPPTKDAMDRLRNNLLSDHPYIVAHLAMAEGRPAGFICYYFSYSTFLARPTLFLEDIFVVDQYRRHGVGSKLIELCVAEAQRRDCGHMEWNVLDWNANAISFYESTGAKILKEWRVVRLKSEDFGSFLERHGKRGT